MASMVTNKNVPRHSPRIEICKNLAAKTLLSPPRGVRPACNGRVSCSTAFPKPQIPQGPLIIKKPRCISSCCGCVCRCAPKKTSPSSLNWLFPWRPHPGSDLFCRRCIRRFAFTRRRCSRGQPSRTSQTHKETFFCGTLSGRRKMGVLRRPHSTHSYLAAKSSSR